MIFVRLIACSLLFWWNADSRINLGYLFGSIFCSMQARLGRSSDRLVIVGNHVGYCRCKVNCNVFREYLCRLDDPANALKES